MVNDKNNWGIFVRSSGHLVLLEDTLKSIVHLNQSNIFITISIPYKSLQSNLKDLVSLYNEFVRIEEITDTSLTEIIARTKADFLSIIDEGDIFLPDIRKLYEKILQKKSLTLIKGNYSKTEIELHTDHVRVKSKRQITPVKLGLTFIALEQTAPIFAFIMSKKFFMEYCTASSSNLNIEFTIPTEENLALENIDEIVGESRGLGKTNLQYKANISTDKGSASIQLETNDTLELIKITSPYLNIINEERALPINEFFINKKGIILKLLRIYFKLLVLFKK